MTIGQILVAAFIAVIVVILAKIYGSDWYIPE